MDTEEFTAETGIDYLDTLNTRGARKNEKQQTAHKTMRQSSDWHKLVQLVPPIDRRYCENKKYFLKHKTADIEKYWPRRAEWNRDKERIEVRRLVAAGKPDTITIRELKVYLQLKD